MTTTTQEIADHIAASPAGNRARAEIEAERLERRREHLAPAKPTPGAPGNHC